MCVCECVCGCMGVWVHLGGFVCVCMFARMPYESDYTCAYVALCTICMRVGGCNTVIEL